MIQNYALNAHLILNTIPGNFLVLQPTPPFAVLSISNDLLHNNCLDRKQVLGKSVYEIFSAHAADTHTNPAGFTLALEKTLLHKAPQQLPEFRYKGCNAAELSEERFWGAISSPILDEAGTVQYILCTFTDVTQQRQNEKQQADFHKLKESYSLLMQAPVAINIVTGPDNIMELCNEQMLKILGRTSDIIGKPVFESIPEALEQGFGDLLDHVRLTGQPFYAKEYPTQLVIDGKEELLYYNFTYQPYYTHPEDTAPSGVFTIAYDVTEQITARKTLEEEKERTKLAIEVAELGVFEIDFATQNLNTSTRFHQIFGFDSPQTREKYATVVHPDDLHVRDRALERGMETGLIEYEVRLQLPNNELRWIKLQGRVLNNEAGKPEKAIGVVQDITNMKIHAEELKKFKTISDYAFDAFILMREDATFAYLNDLALQRWGYTREEAQSIRVPDVDPIFQEDKFNEVFAYTQKQTIPPFETLHKRKDGTLYPVEISMGGLTLDGKPHMFAVARDITERKMADEALKASNKELQEINNDLDNFIYTASHDLKAPISNIEGLLALLSHDMKAGIVQDEEAQHIIGLMQGAVERFKKTIGNLTDVVKLQQESSAAAVLVNFEKVIKDVSLDLESNIEEANLKLEIVATDCPPIHFSEKNLRSIVYNLLSNAIKYRAAERSPYVRIECGHTESHVVLTVQDNGLGIPSHLQGQVFHMFKRFHDHVEGTGIGLYMIKKIIENAGGYIEVDSQENVGTTFRVFFKR
ncbi:PAS domain S-box protein [Pontibacter sp. CAU 1760]